MARPSHARTAEQLNSIDHTIDHQALAEAGTALTQRGAELAAFEQQYGMVMPYHLDAYVSRIKLNIAETGQRMVEVGLMLQEIRQRESAHVYADVLDQVGLTERFARRAIQAAVKTNGLSKLQQLGSGKLLELIAEDDETLAGLEDGGSVAGLTLDEIDRMTVRELRATLRAERKEHEDEKAADGEIIRAKDERIHKLTRDKRKVEASPTRSKVAAALAEMDEQANEAVAQLRLLVESARSITTAYEEAGEPVDTEVADRVRQNLDFAADWLHQVAGALGE